MGFDIRLLWEQHKNVNPPHHLTFCNPESIKILLERCGLEPISITTPGKLDWNIVEGRILNDNINLGRWWNDICDAPDDAKECFQNWITKFNYSSHMKIVARKA